MTNDEQNDLDRHASMLQWATELLLGAYPSVRRSYKCCHDNMAFNNLPDRLKDNNDEVLNYELYKEIGEFLEQMNVLS